MELSQQRIKEFYIIKISGKLDSASCQTFEHELMDAINSGEKKILLDCKNLDYINSAGLRILLLSAKLLKNSGGTIALYDLKEHIKQVFEIAGFTGMIKTCSSLDEAINTST